MKLDNYLTEIKLGDDPKVEVVFNSALKKVFSKEYLEKIEGIIDDKILLKSVALKDKNKVAWVSSPSSITVNDLAFKHLETDQKMKYLLHEFIHILQLSKSFFVFKKFKELHTLTNLLDRIVKINLKKPYSVFLTGKNINLGSQGKFEIISYLMNDSIYWPALKPEGKKQFLAALGESKLFNLSDPFWTKRLR